MRRSVFIAAVTLALFAGCSDGTEADRLGVGAECSSGECDEELELVCLPQFKGGYCGLEDCVDDLDCPEASACIAHTDGTNYCFRICLDKIECNRNRTVDNESNCSSNVDFVDGADGRKACVPPSD